MPAEAQERKGSAQTSLDDSRAWCRNGRGKRRSNSGAAPTKDAKGVILFSNSRSGGGKGKQVLGALVTSSARTAFLIWGESPPEQILAQPQMREEARNSLRVIVCGGDTR